MSFPGTTADIAPGDWLAPTVSVDSSASALVRIPGSKSLTNRYLLLAAIASSESVIHAPLHSRDSQLMISALTALGASFEEIETDSVFGPDLRVTPINFDTVTGIDTQIDVGLAGTVMRFVPPLAALLSGSVIFDGDEHARRRPMGPIISALRSLNISVEEHGEAGLLPFTLRSEGEVAVDELTIDASSSSQFVSALLLVACRFKNGLVLRHTGSSIPSMPHIEMTLEVLKDLGVRVEVLEDYVWKVYPGSFAGFEITVEPDLSNAGPFLAAALVLGVSVSIPDWPSNTTQGGNHWRKILPAFGASETLEENVLTILGPAGGARAGYQGVELDLSEAGELAPTVAALCALARSESRLRGIAHLRGHETDRLAALTAEINRLGGIAKETEDGIYISQPISSGALFRTYDDHRMATTAAVLGLVQDGVVVENIATTAKTLPGFEKMWEEMLVQLGADICA